MAEARVAQSPPTRIGSTGPADQMFRGLVTGMGGLVIAILLGLIVLLILDSLPAMQRYGVGFVTGSTWDPVREEFGAWPYIYGTIFSSLLALLISTPVAVERRFETRIAVMPSVRTPVRTWVPWNPVRRKKYAPNAASPQGLPFSRAPASMTCVHS